MTLVETTKGVWTNQDAGKCPQCWGYGKKVNSDEVCECLCEDTMVCGSCGEYCEDGQYADSDGPDDFQMVKCKCECHITELELDNE